MEEHNLLAVFRLYLRENLNPTSSFLSHLCAITVIQEKKEEILAVTQQKGKSEVVDTILDILKDCNEPGWFKSVLSALTNDEETPGNSATAKFITGYRQFEDMTPYRRLLHACGPSLVADIDPGQLLPHLTTTLSTEDRENIRQCANNQGKSAAAMELLIRLPRGGDEWFKELIKALKENNYNDLADLLQPDEENVQNEIVVNDSSTQEEIRTNPHEINENTDQYRATSHDSCSDGETYDGVLDEKYDDGKEKAESKQGDSKELVLRDYQLELAKPVVAGENTIIISHTGSGKTVVAVHFVNKHFNEESDEASKLNVKPKKVLFLVNTISLVSQQHDVFKKYLPGSLRLSHLIGDTAPQLASLKNVIENNDIIFLTAQMVVNALQKDDVSIEDFSMLIFDECHHCHGNNPYNVIMAMYRKRKIEHQGATLPQIVGLTASVGTGKASSQDKSDEYAKSIFANLDVDAISIPNENDDNYRSYVNPPEEIDPILVKPRSEDNDPFKTEIVNIMCAIERMLEEGMSKQDHVCQELKDLYKFTESPKGKSAYEQGVENFISHCPQFIASETDSALLRLMRTGGDHLRKYNDALKMNKICRIKDALGYIKDFINGEETTRYKGFNDDDKKLIRLFKEREEELKYVSGEKRYENPLLTKLENVLTREFRSKHNSHAIIFCTKRVTVDAMYSWISENERLSFLRPEKIFGSSEMTSVEQQIVLNKFKSNECNILVGTNVVEEGTDVPECNIVFRYNYMSSDVGRKQAKGRVRQKNSKFYMVASTEFNFEERDQANKIRDIFMMKSVRTLSKLPRQQLKDELLALQNIDLRDRNRMEKLEKDRQKSRTTAAYKLMCGKCSELACYSSEIRVFNDSNHLIINEEFYQSKIRVEKHPKPRIIGDDIYKNGKIYCKKCGQDWGVIVSISSMNFGVIKIVSFVLERCADKKRNTCRKWKESPFKVEPLDMIEFKTENSDWNVGLTV